jgi:hypothetical protein
MRLATAGQPPRTDEGDPVTPTPARTIGAAALFVAGLLFLLYPALRPYADETTLAGAEAFASTAWVASHTAGIVAFILLPLGLRALASTTTPAAWSTRIPGRAVRSAAVLAWLGGSLVLPYYGAEAFGLQVIGARAVTDADASLLKLADDFRLGAVPVTIFGAGLVLLAAAGVTLMIASRTAGAAVRIGSLLTGVGLLLYLPQFFASPALRIAHGAVLAAGLAVLASAVMRAEPARSRQPAPGTARAAA